MKNNNRDPVLFDIRLSNLEEDVLVIRGSPEEAPSVLLAGTIVLSLSEPVKINSLKLNLLGEMNMKIFEDPSSKTNDKYSKFKKKVFQHSWDNIDIASCLSNMQVSTDNSSQVTDNSRILRQKAKSSTSLVSTFSKHKLQGKNSSTNLFNQIGASHRNNSTVQHITLVKGNYEFPFSAILPGSIIESVEGLQNANVMYKLKATLERTKMDPDIVTEKFIRIVRTISPDTSELSETVAVDNTWPEKVEYSISIPTKTVAVGSTIPISISIMPLLKNLKLGQVKVVLIENSQYCGSYGSIHNQEREVCRVRLKDPLSHVADSENLANHEDDSEEGEYFNFQDIWEVQSALQIPPNLLKCCQDCTIMKNIKVRHKLKFVIYLINPDGHVSQLRASLPIQLFLSPFIAISVHSTEPDWITDHKDKLMNTYSSSGLSNLYYEKNKKATDVENGLIFSRAASGINIADMHNSEDDGTLPNRNVTSRAELMVPPKYERYIYDAVFSPESSYINTPITSGMHSPISRSRGTSFLSESIGENNFTPLDVQSINFSKTEVENSRDNFYSSAFFLGNEVLPSSKGLEEQRTISNNNSTLASPLVRKTGSSFNMNNTFHDNNPFSPNFSSNSLNTLSNTCLTDLHNNYPFTNSIRSPDIADLGSSPSSSWNPEINKVPTYDTAMKITAIGLDLPPMYPIKESKNKPSIISPKNAKFKSESYTNLMFQRNQRKSPPLSMLRPSNSQLKIVNEVKKPINTTSGELFHSTNSMNASNTEIH